MTTETFAALGLAEPLLRALSDADYTHPTPIQAKSIPALLEGRDLLGLAETGTGKTAAFVLPLLQHLITEGGRPQPGAPRALILAPTRELAIQIGESIHAYGRHVRVSHTVIFGGVGQRPQVNAIARGVDILVATPGRLLDLIDQRHLRLNQIRTFILDEADRMLDMGFVRDVRRILKLVPSERQSLLFSATMPDDIAKLAAEILTDPVRVEIARAGKTVDRIDQQVIFVPAAGKRDVLARLLKDPEMKRVIVFTRTKRGADRVSTAIEHMGVGVHAIHGNKSQGQRQSALDSFRKGFTRVLVATDIAARGIDIDDITHVINYELPNIPESYVHRIGRTARAGASGVAIALCASDEREFLRDIEKLTGRRLTVVPANGLAQGGEAPAAAEAASELAPASVAGDERPVRAHREHADRPHRGHERPRDGAHRGERRDERRGPPRGERRSHEGRPARDGEQRPHRSNDGAPRGERREERRGHEGRPARDGEQRPHRSNDGAPRGERREERRSHEGRPARDGEQRPHRSNDGAPRGERREERRGHEGRPAREGEQRPRRFNDGAPRGERRHAEGGPSRDGEARRVNGGPRNGEHRRGGSAPRQAGAAGDAPQPWRNWTKSEGVSQGEARREGGHGRPARKRGENSQRGSGQGPSQRNRDAR